MNRRIIPVLLALFFFGSPVFAGGLRALSPDEVKVRFGKYGPNEYALFVELPDGLRRSGDFSRYVSVSPAVRYRVESDWNRFVLAGDFRPQRPGGYRVTLEPGLQLYGRRALERPVVKTVEARMRTLRRETVARRSVTTERGDLALELTFPSPVVSEDIRDRVRIFPAVDYAFAVDGNRLTLYGDFKPRTEYIVRIAKGFSTRFQQGRSDLALPVLTGDLAPGLRFPDRRRHLSSAGEAIALEAVNVPKIEVGIDRVHDDNINYLSLFSAWMLDDEWSLPRLKRYGEKVAAFSMDVGGRRNEKKEVLIDLRRHLGENAHGVYAVTVRSADGRYRAHRLLIKSDLGILAKAAEDRLFIMVRSLDDTRPVAGARVRVYDETNGLLFEAATDDEGIVDRPFAGFAAARPKLIVVEKGDEINFLPLEGAVGDTDILRDDASARHSPYRALLFFERSLIRPGEKVHLLVDVRDGNFTALADRHVRLRITDPAYRRMADTRLKLDADGAAEYVFQTQNDFRTGDYTAEVRLGDTVLGRHVFHVETFLPERIETDLRPGCTACRPDENLSLTIRSRYLFGAPAAGLRTDAELLVTSKEKTFTGYEGFHFFPDEGRDSTQPLYTDSRKRLKLDENGEARLPFRPRLPHTPDAVLEATFLVTVYDDGRPVRRSAALTLYPFEHIAGVRRLSGGTVETGQPVTFETVVIDPKNGRKVQRSGPLDVTVYREYYHYYAGYERRKVTDIPLSSAGTFTFTPRESGRYIVTVRTPQGQEASMGFYVSGWDYAPFDLREKSSYRVRIDTDTTLCRPGERLHVDVRSPIPGLLLLTFEENGVKGYRLFEMEQNTFSTDLVVPDGLEKGFDLRAVVIRSTRTGRKMLPFRAVGSRALRIDNREHRLDVAIEAPETVRSRTTFDVTVSGLSAGADVLVSAVDLGVLNILGEKPVDVFACFAERTGPGTSLYDFYSDLLAIRTLATQPPSGGDIAAGRRKRHLSPAAMNERAAPLSFWSGIVRADADGTVTVEVPVGEYNGRVRVQAVVLGKNKTGSNHREVVVKDPVVVKPSLPRFLTEGDKLTVPLRLLNTGDGNLTLTLRAETSSGLRLTLPEKRVTVAAHDSRRINFSLAAVGNGPTTLRLEARDPKGNAFVSSTKLYVLPATDTRYLSRSGLLAAETVRVDFNLTGPLPGGTVADIVISGSPYTALAAAVKRLSGYPYGCAEQTASKLMVLLYADLFPDDNSTGRMRRQKIEAGIARLLSMQNGEGFFTYWPGGPYVNHYASTYAASVLAQARRLGYDVPKYALDAALEADRRWYLSHDASPWLYLSEHDDINLADRLYDNGRYGKTLGSFIVLAAVMKRHGMREAFADLLAKAEACLDSGACVRPRRYSDDFYSDIRDISFALEVYLRDIAGGKPDVFARKLLGIVERAVHGGQLYSTQDTAFALRALHACYGDLDWTAGAGEITLTAGKKRYVLHAGEAKRIEMANADIRLFNTGSPVYYSVDLGVPTALPVNAPAGSAPDALKVQRIFYRDGWEVDSFERFRVGDRLVMEVTAEAAENLKNVVIDARIPSCFELMNPRLYPVDTSRYKTENYRPDHVEYRDDRALVFTGLDAKKPVRFHLPLTVTHAGSCTMPALYIETMYDSRLGGYFKETRQVEVLP